MLGGMIDGLIVAWILTWFGFEYTAINSFKELFGIALTMNTYYFIFGMLGLLGSLLRGQKTIEMK